MMYGKSSLQVLCGKREVRYYISATPDCTCTKYYTENQKDIFRGVESEYFRKLPEVSEHFGYRYVIFTYNM